MPEALDICEIVYFRAFLILHGSRRRKISSGQPAVVSNIQFSDILQYSTAFPEDVDDLRHFIRVIQAIDEEFLKHGIGKSSPKG